MRGRREARLEPEMTKRKTPPAKTEAATASGSAALRAVQMPVAKDTDSREFQRQAVFAQRFAENVVNTVSDPLPALTRDMILVWASRSFHRLFDTTQVEVVGKSLFDLAWGNGTVPHCAAIWGASCQGITCPNVLRSRHSALLSSCRARAIRIMPRWN